MKKSNKAKPTGRYACCRECHHVVLWKEHTRLRFLIGCPKCGLENQFGPGAYIDDFEGYSMDEVFSMRSGR